MRGGVDGARSRASTADRRTDGPDLVRRRGGGVLYALARGGDTDTDGRKERRKEGRKEDGTAAAHGKRDRSAPDMQSPSSLN